MLLQGSRIAIFILLTNSFSLPQSIPLVVKLYKSLFILDSMVFIKLYVFQIYRESYLRLSVQEMEATLNSRFQVKK